MMHDRRARLSTTEMRMVLITSATVLALSMLLPADAAQDFQHAYPVTQATLHAMTSGCQKDVTDIDSRRVIMYDEGSTAANDIANSETYRSEGINRLTKLGPIAKGESCIADPDKDAFDERLYLLCRDRMVFQQFTDLPTMSVEQLRTAQDELDQLRAMKTRGFKSRHAVLFASYAARTKALFAEAKGIYDEP